MLSKRTNVLIILNDDMGFSDIGCYGGEIETPNLDRLAENGIRFTNFYNTARCSPSRASLLTGLHPHQTGIGILVDDQRPEGYSGNLSANSATMAEVLGSQGYRTYMSGKWHIATSKTEPTDTWPRQRGFDRFYGTLAGSANYYHPVTLTRDNDNIEHEAFNDPNFYYTDAIADNAAGFIRDHMRDYAEQPFFLYTAFTSPHWPLHALPEDIAKYKGRFSAGWDRLREERLERLIREGIIHPDWKLSPRDSEVPAWEEELYKEYRERCMEIYAAQIDRMDRGIGRIVKQLEDVGELDNTLILFLSDNGGCAEELAAGPGHGLVRARSARYETKTGEKVVFGNRPEITPGEENTYQSYGICWANMSNTPFRYYKHWVHEGGISTPLIAHWPNRIVGNGELRHTPGQLPDIMATILEVTGAEYPTEYKGRTITPCEGESLLPVFDGNRQREKPLFWEHEGNAAVRVGNWKLVKKYPGDWELYDMEADRTELHDRAAEFPEYVKELTGLYDEWAARCGVIPREIILDWQKQKENM